MKKNTTYKLLNLVTVLALLLNILPSDIFASDTKEDIIQHTITYNEDHSKAVISFDVSGVDQELYEIKNISQNEKELPLDKPTYEVDKNGEVEFKVSYTEKKQEVEETEIEKNTLLGEGDVVTNETQINMNEEVANDGDEVTNVEDGSNEKPTEDTNENNVDSKSIVNDKSPIAEPVIEIKEQTIVVNVDDILKEDIPNPILPRNFAAHQSTSGSMDSGEGSVDLQGMFDYVAASQQFGGNVQVPESIGSFFDLTKNKLNTGSIAYAQSSGRAYQFVTLRSKYNVDFNRSFSLVGKMTSYGMTPSKFTYGFFNDDSFDMTKVFSYSGEKNALLLELDTYNNRPDPAWNAGSDAWLDNDLSTKDNCVPHIALIKSNNDGYFQRIGSSVQINYNKVKEERKIRIDYDAQKDKVIFTSGEYIFASDNVREMFGDKARLVFNSSTEQHIHFARPGYTDKTEVEFTMDSFAYIGNEPINTTGLYIKRESDLIEYNKDDINTYPKPGEMLMIRNEIVNKNVISTEQNITANISDFKIDGTAITPRNLKMYTGTPDAPVEVEADQTDIFNGTAYSDGIIKQVTIPLLANQEKTYLEYEFTIPSDQKYSKLDNTIIFGQKGMTQYPFSSSITIANTPNLKGIDKTIVSKLGTGDMGDTAIRKDIEGKLFDDVDFTSLTSDTDEMKLTYTVDGSTSKKIDMSKEGRYKVAYTLEDTRTGMKSEASRYIWVTDKIVDVSSDENIAAQDFVMLTKEVSASTFMDTLKARSGIQAFDKEGDEIAFKDITVTQAIKPTFGTYIVTFATKAGTTISVNCRVYDNGNMDEINKEAIYANDFSLSETEATIAEDSVLLSLSKAIAFSTNDMSDVTVKVQRNTIKGKSQGLYDVTFVTDKGTSVTVKGRITKYSVEANGERVTANDFTIDAMSAKHKDPKQLIALAKAEAVKTDTQEKVDLIVDASALKGVKGTYNVIFKTSAGTSVTTKATVIEKGGENPDPTIREAIFANNFNLSSEQVVELKSKNTADKLSLLVNYAKAKAIDIDSDANIAVASAESDFKTKEITDDDGVNHTVAIEGLYDVTFKTTKGTTVKVKASVPSSVENDTLLLYANGFTISKTEVNKPLSEADYLKLAKAAAIVKADSSPVTVKVLDSSAIQAKAGTYKIKFGTEYTAEPSKNLELEVNVQVVEHGVDDAANDESIRANNIYLKVADVEGLTSNKLISLASANAYKTSNGEFVDLEAVHNIEKKAGTYEVNFETALGTSLKVKAYVYDEGSINTTNKEAIYANNFTISLNEVDALTNTMLKDRAQVKAYDTTTFEAISITAVEHTILKEKGSYTVTFKTAKGTSVRVQAIVLDNGITQNGESINANDIYVSSKNVAKLTKEQILTLSSAMAFDETTKERIELDVDFSAVQSGKGSYDVVLKTVTKGTQLVIKAYVLDEGVVDADKHIAMFANNFTISKAEALNIQDALIKKLSNVYAYHTDRNVMIKNSDITVVHAIENKVGSYKVTFTTNGVSLSVKAIVQDKSVEAGDERISANDFIITMEEYDTFTEEKAKQLAHVHANKISDGAALSTVADISKIEKKKGTYEVTFTTDTGNHTSVKVNAEVMDKGVVDQDNKEMIYANDFSLSKKEAKDIADDTVIQLAKAKAFHLETGASIAITSVEHNIDTAKGNYTVTFSTAKGTRIRVDAAVVENEVINPTNKEKMIANDFAIAKDGVADLTDDIIIEKSSAKAYDLDTGNEVSIPVVEQDIKGAKGVYKVTLKTAKGTSITIDVTIFDESVMNPDNNEIMYANDIALSKKEVNTLTDDMLKTHAKASAINSETGAQVKITKVTHNIKEKKGVYEVTFFTLKKSKITVKAQVYDEGIVDTDKKIAIYGNDFSLHCEEAKTISDANIKNKSFVYAYRIDTGADIDPNDILVTHAIEGKIGAYKVTFTTDGVSLHVKAFVQDQSVEVGNEHISANNFVITKEELASFTEEKAKKLANVNAYSTIDGTELATTADISKLEKKKGNYEVTFTTDTGNRTSIKVFAEVMDKGVVNKENKEIIYANNFSLNKKDAKDISDDKLIQIAKAKAFNSETGASVTILYVEHDIKAVKGEYAVTFATAKGTSVIVHANVVEHEVVDSVNKEKILANDFALAIVDVAKLNDEVLITSAKAKAYDIDSWDEVDIHVMEQDIKAEKGYYNVTFSTVKGTRLTVKVRVYEKANGNDGNKERIYANPILLSEKEAANPSDEFLIKRAQAKAYHTETGAEVKISNIKHTIRATKGVYQVTFSTQNNTNLIIEAYVYDNGIVNETTNEAIYANDITVNIEDVDGLNKDILIAKSEAIAIQISTGKEISIDEVTHTIEKKQGVYSITFKTANNTSLSILANVTGKEPSNNVEEEKKTEAQEKNNQKLIVEQKEGISKIKDKSDGKDTKNDGALDDGKDQTTTSTKGHNDNENMLFNDCYFHWGMISVMILYVGYMIRMLRKDEE
ncbi:hypothetical protein [Amedibacillus sp. YH-ame10]